jgi:hypothetical protein
MNVIFDRVCGRPFSYEESTNANTHDYVFLSIRVMIPRTPGSLVTSNLYKTS